MQTENTVKESLNKIGPPCVQTDTHWQPPAQDSAFFDTPFDFFEFNASLDSKKIKSSPGLDGVDFDILKKLPIKYKLILLDIFNTLYQTEEYPLSWRECFIHFVKKPDNIGLRPITLTSCLLKLFETLIKNRLQWWAEVQNFIPKSQNSFLKGRSCIDNLTNLILKIDEAFFEKNMFWLHF